MKKKFKMENVDCANCANKMECNIKKLAGVNDASINFMMQKLTIDADDERFEEIIELVEKECKKIDAECRIVR